MKAVVFKPVGRQGFLVAKSYSNSPKSKIIFENEIHPKSFSITNFKKKSNFWIIIFLKCFRILLETLFLQEFSPQNVMPQLGITFRGRHKKSLSSHRLKSIAFICQIMIILWIHLIVCNSHVIKLIKTRMTLHFYRLFSEG